MVLIYNRKYDILLQKKERGRETKGEDDLEEQTSLKTWGDLEIWGVYAVLIHEDHLTDPQICLNLKIVDEYPPWTVSSLKKIMVGRRNLLLGWRVFRGYVTFHLATKTTTESHLVISISMKFRVCWLWLRFLNLKDLVWLEAATGSKFLHHSQETSRNWCPNSISSQFYCKYICKYQCHFRIGC